MPLQVDSEQGRWVLRLGYAGLIPFVGSALLLFLVHGQACMEASEMRCLEGTLTRPRRPCLTSSAC